ncbi:ROK family protein [uncultured Enterococcus sp.]|uniref:ROK family protein n=1 Tax=uncultured Enterococcus sp. TaxID=167972 RepID=UPI0025F37630|nr:ROK family protein [uncultured Enterococcus sp.]
MTLVVFDIGGTSVKCAVFHEGVLSHHESFKTPDNYETFTEKLAAYVKRFPKCSGVAISAPGAVNQKTRQIEGLSAVPYIHFRPIFEELESLFNVPVAIENDANCAGICEMEIGAGKESEHGLFVVIGTGVGGALFINRKLYKGAHLFAGEFGLMLPNKDETLSKVGTVVNRAKVYSHKTGETIDGKELFYRANNGDQFARALLDQLYEDISCALYNLQVAIDPQMIMIGGGISAQEEVIDEIRIRLYNRLKKQTIEAIMPEVVACQYQNEANLLGAALHFQQQGV